MKLHPASPGIARWLTETRKNPAVTGKGSPGIADICEMLLPFTLGLSTVKQMSDEEIKAEVEKIEDTWSPEQFLAAQSHAENEFLKFAGSAVSPKKPAHRLGLWQRLKWKLLGYLHA